MRLQHQGPPGNVFQTYGAPGFSDPNAPRGSSLGASAIEWGRPAPRYQPPPDDTYRFQPPPDDSRVGVPPTPWRSRGFVRPGSRRGFNPQPEPPPSRALGQVSPGAVAFGVLSTASMAASAFHGYRRNDSLGWALVWGFFGAAFPVITPTIAVAQGFGKRHRG